MAAPYTVTWDTTLVTNGSRQLTATARDAAGNTTTSTVVTVTVDNADVTAPTVVITAPSNGATVSSSVSVTATATDNIGVVGVQFTLDGQPLGAEQTAAPYTVSYENGSEGVKVNQRTNGGKWNLLGAYRFDRTAPSSERCTLSRVSARVRM